MVKLPSPAATVVLQRSRCLGVAGAAKLVDTRQAQRRVTRRRGAIGDARSPECTHATNDAAAAPVALAHSERGAAPSGRHICGLCSAIRHRGGKDTEPANFQPFRRAHRGARASAMAPKKAPAAAEPEPEPEAEAPPEPEEGEGIFYFPDNSKYGAPSTACTRTAAALCSGWCLCAHCTPAPAPQRACG